MLLLSASLVFASVAAVPAEAKKKPRKCPAFAPVEPDSGSGETAEALEAPVIKVTDKATADTPIVLEYEHGMALWASWDQEPIIEDTVFFNFQIESSRPAPGLYVFQEWAKEPPSDMDLLLYSAGQRVAYSGSSNAFPMPTPIEETGAWGLESIPGYATSTCAGYTVESRAFATTGEAMTLSVWLGEDVAE